MNTTAHTHQFEHLIRCLEQSWEIEEPVLLGAVWGQAEQPNVYHFVLRNRLEDKTTLVSLPPSPELLVFLSENSLNIRAA